MALKVGTLFGELKVEYKKYKKGWEKIQNQTRSSVQDINKQVQDMSREFKDAQKEIKEDVSKIGKSFDDIGTDLKKNAGRVQTEFKKINGTIGNSERHIKQMAGQYSKSSKDMIGDAKKTANEIEDVNKEIKDGGGGLDTAAAGGAMAGAGTGLAWMAMSKDQVKTNLKNQLGNEADYEDALGVSEDLVSRGRGEFGEVADATQRVKRQTGLVGDELRQVTDQALILNKTFGYDFQESIRATSSMTNSFGSEASENMDLIAKTAQNTGDSYDDLLDTYSEFSDDFSQMGYSEKDMSNIISAGVKEGGAYNSDYVADSFREMYDLVTEGGSEVQETLQTLGLDYDDLIERIKKGGPEAKDAYNEIIESMGNVKDDTKLKNITQSLMGESGLEAGGVDFVRAISNDQNSNMVGNAEGTTEDMNENYEESMEAQFNRMKATAIKTLAPLGAEIFKIIADTFQALKPLFDILTELLSNPAVAKFVAIIGSIATVIATIVGPIAMLVQGFMKVFGVLGRLMPILRTLFTFMTGPVGIIIGVLTLLYTAYQNNFLGIADLVNWLVDKVVGFFSNIGTHLSNFVNFLKENWYLIFGVLGIAIKFFLKFKDQIFAQFSKIKDFIVGIFTNIIDSITGFGKNMFESGKKIITTLVNGIKSVINKPKEAISGALKKVRDLLPFSDAKEGPLSQLTHNGSKMMTTLSEGVNKGKKNLHKGVNDALEGVGSAINMAQPNLALATDNNGESVNDEEGQSQDNRTINLYALDKDEARNMLIEILEDEDNMEL
ncbi:phage tail tape measure protein [Alkalibacillus sp. S2W]|uniref:phage tail tape measure protein n=1 Tax=Alkalibacillus sp. S2W TaxID=3386553 RepID=UPI00398D5755